jgi:hypothetical protein
MLVETGWTELLETTEPSEAAVPLLVVSLVSSFFDLVEALVALGAAVVKAAVELAVSCSEVFAAVDATAVSVTVTSVASAELDAIVAEAKADEGFQQDRVEVVDTQGSVPL